MEATGVFVPTEALGTSSAVGTFGCDECDAVYFKLQALRSHQIRADQRRPETRRCVLVSVCPVLQGGFPVETEGHSASVGGSEAVRLGMATWSARAVFG